MWKNILERGRTQMKILLMRIACWIPKATNKHSEYVILTAFPLRQWLHEVASRLRYKYIVYLVIILILFNVTACKMEIKFYKLQMIPFGMSHYRFEILLLVKDLCCLVHFTFKLMERDSSVGIVLGRYSSIGIATRYGLGGPGIESW